MMQMIARKAVCFMCAERGTMASLSRIMGCLVAVTDPLKWLVLDLALNVITSLHRDNSDGLVTDGRVGSVPNLAVLVQLLLLLIQIFLPNNRIMNETAVTALPAISTAAEESTQGRLDGRLGNRLDLMLLMAPVVRLEVLLDHWP